MTLTDRLRAAWHILTAAVPTEPNRLAAVTAQVDDSPGWTGLSQLPNERNPSEIQQQYQDALEAWRKNPIAKRIVDITTDYCLGDGMAPDAPGVMGAFIAAWWNHPQNLMALRMPDLSDELARAGDLFITLHRNPDDGNSYIRPIPKDRIVRIETLPNDWETEIAYDETQEVGEPRRWLSPHHPEAPNAQAIMVHYAVNRVVGTLMGESDLATMIPWLLRYSRMVEDRVRMHWAARSFLWIVTVPSARVPEKQEQYRSAPESGSIIVKDPSEEWSAVNPDLKGMDAQFDLRAVRYMIDAGSGFPPHWRGEAHDVSLATAEAMEHAACRHLRRRQLYLRYLVQDLAYIAYTRAWQIGKVRKTPNRDAIRVTTADINRDDNKDLATAARDIAAAFQTLYAILVPSPHAGSDGEAQGGVRSPTLDRHALAAILKFAGEPLPTDTLDQILTELRSGPPSTGKVGKGPEAARASGGPNPSAPS